MLEQVLGSGMVVTRVRAELNFDQREVTSEFFQPVVDDEGILRSIQELKKRHLMDRARLRELWEQHLIYLLHIKPPLQALKVVTKRWRQLGTMKLTKLVSI